MNRVEGGVKLRYQNGEVLVPDALIRDAVLEEDKSRSLSGEEAEKAKDGMVRFEGKWMLLTLRDKELDKRLTARRTELAQIKLHSTWGNRLKNETRSFQYEYTVPQYIFLEYKEALEAFHAEFSRLWKLPPVPPKEKLVVNIYGDRDTFEQVAGVKGGVLAYFRFKKPYDLNGYYDRTDSEYSKQVLYHEFTHYLEKLVDDNFAYPHFPNESVAEYYGASRYDPATKKFETGLLQEGRLCEIEIDINNNERMSLARMVSADKMYEHYNWGWSLVHFLMNDAKWKPKFEKFFMALAKGKDVTRVDIGFDNLRTVQGDEVLRIFMRELGLKDNAALALLERDWHNDVGKKVKLTTLTGKERAGFFAAEQGRVQRAQRLLKEAIDAGSKSPRVFHTYSDLLLSDGKWKDGMAMLDRAIALDPINGWLWGTKARALRAKGDRPEASRLFALAKEVGYDDPWIELQIELEDEGEDDPKKKERGGEGKGDVRARAGHAHEPGARDGS